VSLPAPVPFRAPIEREGRCGAEIHAPRLVRAENGEWVDVGSEAAEQVSGTIEGTGVYALLAEVDLATARCEGEKR